MTAFLPRPLGGRIRTLAPVSPVERALARFHPSRRPAVNRLAAQHPRLADLAVTFPGLLHCLAQPGAGFDPRPAIRLVAEGAPLKTAAVAAGAALWARRLPPEAFVTRGPRGLPDGELFRRRVANALPRRAKRAAGWLDALAEAARWGDEIFALWIAREVRAPRPPRTAAKPKALRLLALYAFCSQRPDTRAGALAATPWRPEMGFAAAHGHARRWRDAVELHAYLAGVELVPWFAPQRLPEVDLDLVPLRSEREIADEAAAMGNCLRTFGPYVRRRTENLWSLRRNGERIATFSVGWRHGDPLVGVRQLKGPGNAEVDTAIWAAVDRWLAGHDLAGFDSKPLHWRTELIDHAAWTALWRPYWLARRTIPSWLPLTPSRQALDDLDV